MTALQNGRFSAPCNRVGEEQNLVSGGESFVCNPRGEFIACAGETTDEVLHVDLDLDQVAASHGQTLFLRDCRPELYGECLR